MISSLRVANFGKVAEKAGKDAWITNVNGWVDPGYEATSIWDIVYDEDPCWKTGNQVGIYLAVVRPRVEPIKVGDTVTRLKSNIEYTYTVLAIHNDNAWVKAPKGYLTLKLEELEKVND